jgi:hypothetical protein
MSSYIILIPNQYYSRDQIRKNEMGGAGGSIGAQRILEWIPKRKRKL